VLKLLGLIVALATVLFLATSTCAFAATSVYDPPSPGAELVSRQTAAGTDAVRAALATIDNVEVGRRATTVTVNDDSGLHAINVDYSDLATDKKTAGLGALAVGYMGLGALTRIARLLRAVGFGG